METGWGYSYLLGYLMFLFFILLVINLGGPQLLGVKPEEFAPIRTSSGFTGFIELVKQQFNIFFLLITVNSPIKFIGLLMVFLDIVALYVLYPSIHSFFKLWFDFFGRVSSNSVLGSVVGGALIVAFSLIILGIFGIRLTPTGALAQQILFNCTLEFPTNPAICQDTKTCIGCVAQGGTWLTCIPYSPEESVCVLSTDVNLMTRVWSNLCRNEDSCVSTNATSVGTGVKVNCVPQGTYTVITACNMFKHDGKDKTSLTAVGG